VAAEKLNNDLVKGFQGRDSGYTRVIKIGKRLGDGAEMAVIELILDEGYSASETKTSEVKKETKKPVSKKAETKTKSAKKEIKK
jgi:large subunit ribosomal protein L17